MEHLKKYISEDKSKQFFLQLLTFIRIKDFTETIVLFLFFVFLVWGCASVGYPSGGAKDVKPPVILKSNPEANALGFKGKEVTIYFDEIIQVKEITQKLVVSPPVNKQPTVSARGKELLIRFEEDLQPNTTYTLDFADAISDNNEGNILQNYRFSFSTGHVIDSLSISGFLFDATDLSPVSGALVMVYKNLADSAFKKQVPLRLAKTNASGGFSVRNVAPGKYRVYALEDANRNYIYDQPGERIGWYSQTVEPTFEYRERIDTIVADSLKLDKKNGLNLDTPPVDSIASDSVKIQKYLAFLPDSLQLFMFQEDNASQYLKDNKRSTRNRIDFVFNRSNSEPIEIKLSNAPELKDWFIYERSVNQDSITVWLTDSAQIKSDSLFISLRYQALDSLKNKYYKADSLNAFFFQVGGEEKTRTRKKDKPKDIPTLKPEKLKSSLDIFGEFDFSFSTPVYKIDMSSVKLFQYVDTILQPVEFNLVRDSIRLRRFIIDYPWEPGLKYELVADSAAFTDIYGLSSSAIKQTFSVKTVDSYGVIFVDVANPQKEWLLQILNKQEKLIRQSKLPQNGKIGFQFLKPGDYFLRIIEDINNNEQWDIGSFDSLIQPEKIFYFPETINVRANWDRMVPWDPAKFDIHDFVKRNRKNSSKTDKSAKTGGK